MIYELHWHSPNSAESPETTVLLVHPFIERCGDIRYANARSTFLQFLQSSQKLLSKKCNAQLSFDLRQREDTAH